MNALEIEALTSALAPVIRGFVEGAVAPMRRRLDQAEARPVPEKGDPGDPGRPGKDFDPAALEAIRADNLALRCIVAELLAKPAEPGPQGGPGRPGEPGKPGESIKGDPGPAGRGIAEALIDAEGALVVTFTDGAVKPVGRVKGKDGQDAIAVETKYSIDDLECPAGVANLVAKSVKLLAESRRIIDAPQSEPSTKTMARRTNFLRDDKNQIIGAVQVDEPV